MKYTYCVAIWRNFSLLCMTSDLIDGSYGMPHSWVYSPDIDFVNHPKKHLTKNREEAVIRMVPLSQAVITQTWGPT